MSALAHLRDQRALRNDAARIGKDGRRVATWRRRLSACSETGWVTKMRGRAAFCGASREPPHHAGDAVDRDLRTVRDAPRRIEHTEHHRDATLARQRSQMRSRSAKLGDDASDARQYVD